MNRISLLDCPIDNLNYQETLKIAEFHIIQNKPCQHVVVNASKFVSMQKNEDLKSIVSKCQLINADGMAVVWASRILGTPLPCRVTGIDLFLELIKLCANKGYRPFFLGATETVLRKVISTFLLQYPNLDIAGFRNGYFSTVEESAIAQQIKNSKADILFVAFSSPMKENFLGKWQPHMQVPFCMGVGGSFDIVAGKTKRAPIWMQDVGLEWFYRILQEPRRMWKRYAKTNPIFIWLVFREYVKIKILKSN